MTAVALALQGAVNSRLLRRPPEKEQAAESIAGERISVLIPLRNEAHRVRPCLKALQQQDLPAEAVEVLILDDRSTDGTAAVVAEAVNADRRMRLIAGENEPPPGFLGKPWACQRLAAAADPAATTLVFLDADVVLSREAVARTVALLRTSGLEFVSPYPRQIAETAAERLVQPLLQWLWLTLVPLRFAERTRWPSLAIANGQLLAVDAARYRAMGGHGAPAVRGAVLEDIALARALRAAGASGGMADGTGVAACRMYDGWPALRDGYTKSLWAAAGGHPLPSLGQLALLPGLYLRRDPVCFLAGVASRIIAALRTGGRPADSFAHPLSIAMLVYLSLRSWQARLTGRLQWKGRPVTPQPS